MAGHENMSSGSHPRASSITQGFKVFRDTSQDPNLLLESSGNPIRHLEDDLAFVNQLNHPSPSPHQSFVCDSPTLPGLDGTNDVLLDSKGTSAKGCDRTLAGHSPLSPETNVLAKNTLKVNLSPRAISAKRLHESAQNKPPSRNKRRLLQEDCDDRQYPQKSPKLRYSTSRPNQDLPVKSGDKHEPHTNIETQKESLDSVVLSQIAKSQNDNGNSAISEQSSMTVDVQGLNTTDIENVEEPQEESFATFNGGDVTTPRSSAMYNFNSAMRLLNPFKAVGNLFGRLSTTHSPSKPQTLSSEEIARQVDNHLQRFEDKLFDKLAAFQAAGKSSYDVTSPTISDLSSPLLSDTHQEPNDRSLAGFGISPHKFAGDLSPAAVSSPLIPISQFKNVALHRTGLQELEEKGRDGFRNSLATVLQSPTERRSKGGKSSLEQGSTAVLEATVEAPRLRNKASQHLKKMASKMNLRSRKSKANDEIPVNNDDYRIMKRKNKDEILRDYLMLQKEKEELEKQLAAKSQPNGQGESTNVVVPAAILASHETKTETDPTKIIPVLLEATTPNLGVKQKRSNSPDPDDAEQTRTKRRTMSFANGELPLSSPLASMNDSVSNTRRFQLEASKVAQVHHEDSDKQDQPIVDTKSDLEQAIHVVKKVPPVPAVPSKYRSRVPKPTRAKDISRARKSENDWKGWDAEVF